MDEVLTEQDYLVKKATCVVEAFQQIDEFKPHLVLTDQDLPGISGIEMLQELRKKEYYTSVMFISGRIDDDFVVKVLEAGANDYIRKPFRFPEFLARVKACLRVTELHKELVEANMRLKEIVSHDYLTGLYNMPAIYDKLDYELKRAKRYGFNVTAVMLDMDYFKSVNDDNDHLFGSWVLAKMGELISTSIREVDFAARYGGDEFLIVLSQANHKGVEIFCERLRKIVEEFDFRDGDSSAKLTVSIGFSMTEVDTLITAKGLVLNADKALYYSKENGRNQVSDYNRVQSIVADAPMHER